VIILNYSDEEKRDILKAFTKVLKEANGKGPKNIYIKYLSDEIHIVMHGVVSDFEKYLIKTFGQEAIDTLTDFYERYCINSGRVFAQLLNNKYSFKFSNLDSDFRSDIFIYKMKIT